MNKSETPPNIVILAVEGLGADFVGKNAQYGGFTPFLDSLIEKSIYFENALSNTGRTFGILPTLLGSLPYSQSGFMSKGVDMPDHFTLFSWLKTNGYHTSFFYGGNSNFDGQDVFLERQQTDYIMDESKFPDHYKKMESNNEGFSWGYGDRDMFEYSMEKINTFPAKPRISFYMTITTHEPFIAPDDRFTEQVNRKVDKFSGAKKEIYKEYKSVFECLLYTDDAIKELMNAYSERIDFKNTIFIITGDHRLIPVPVENRLSRFHVPLLIYSPMLTKPLVSEQVVAHSQIVPSIISYLHQTYGVPVPTQNPFISDPIPTDLGFGSSLEVALMRNKNEIEEYVSGINVLSNGNSYELGSNFNLTSKPEVKDELMRLKNSFVAKSTVALNQNRLIPADLVMMEAEKYFQFNDEEMQYLKNRKLLETAPDTLFFEARSLAFAKDYVNSRIILKYGLSKSPNYHDMRVLLARTFAWDGQYDSAYHYLNETLDRAEKYEDAFVAYSDLLFWDGKKNEMLAMIEKGLKNYPESADLKVRMARYYLNNDEFDKGSALLKEVLRKDPRNELANQLKSRL
jgi:lipoteichoic acid synthase